MRRSHSRKRPWLAALLGALATGLGHAYLRRWWRALGWVTVLFSVTALFVDPTAIDAVASGRPVDWLSIAPVLAIGVLSAVDAYLLARVQNAITRLSPAADGSFTHCPNCGKELDPDLDFCQWCSMDLSDVVVADSAGAAEGDT